jgi:hypothetical protein
VAIPLGRKSGTFTPFLDTKPFYGELFNMLYQ